MTVDVNRFLILVKDQQFVSCSSKREKVVDLTFIRKHASITCPSVRPLYHSHYRQLFLIGSSFDRTASRTEFILSLADKIGPNHRTGIFLQYKIA